MMMPTLAYTRLRHDTASLVLLHLAVVGGSDRQDQGGSRLDLRCSLVRHLRHHLGTNPTPTPTPTRLYRYPLARPRGIEFRA